MAYIKDYWDDKEGRVKLAREHTEEMEAIYGDRCKDSAARTQIHDTVVCIQEPGRIEELGNPNLKITVSDTDSVSAVFRFAEGNTAVLNFASYKAPGGMFLEGSRAQEECLCHASNLFNVLREFKESYYSWNNAHKNRALYMDRALYSPDIIFFSEDGEERDCNVITCAAPNKSAAQKYCNVSDKVNADVLESRIRFILSIAEEHGVWTLILGAFGCGVFGQDSKEVAMTFKKVLQSRPWSFERVIFAIPDGKNQNLAAFKEVFEGAPDSSDTELENESEASFFVVVADSCGKRKYVSRDFPKTFLYTVKLTRSQRFTSKEQAQNFIDGFNEYGKYPIQNPEIKEVARILKVL